MNKLWMIEQKILLALIVLTTIACALGLYFYWPQTTIEIISFRLLLTNVLVDSAIVYVLYLLFSWRKLGLKRLEVVYYLFVEFVVSLWQLLVLAGILALLLSIFKLNLSVAVLLIIGQTAGLLLLLKTVLFLRFKALAPFVDGWKKAWQHTVYNEAKYLLLLVVAWLLLTAMPAFVLGQEVAILAVSLVLLALVSELLVVLFKNLLYGYLSNLMQNNLVKRDRNLQAEW